MRALLWAPVKTHTLPAHGLMPGPALHECGRIASHIMHNLSLKIFEVTDNSQLLLEKVTTTWKPFENVCHYSHASAVGSLFWVRTPGVRPVRPLPFLGGGGVRGMMTTLLRAPPNNICKPSTLPRIYSPLVMSLLLLLLLLLTTSLTSTSMLWLLA